MRSLLFGALLLGVVGITVSGAQAEDLRDQPLVKIQQLADAGRADAQRELGIRYGQGTGLAQDYRSARSWASKAASQGDPWAMRIMGLIYLEGLGVDADKWRAVDYFKRSADLGDLYAQYNLAVIYYEGTLTKQSYDKALSWYKRAADQGNTMAQHNLGLMLANGIGTTQDRVEAYKWFMLSGLFLMIRRPPRCRRSRRACRRPRSHRRKNAPNSGARTWNGCRKARSPTSLFRSFRHPATRSRDPRLGD